MAWRLLRRFSETAEQMPPKSADAVESADVPRKDGPQGLLPFDR